MSEPLHQIRTCINPECGFRFSIRPDLPVQTISEPDQDTIRKIRCPKCGSDTRLELEPYQSFLIDDREKFENGPKVVAVLDNIRSALNVGAMIRTADGAGISRLFLCGITPLPENQSKVTKTSLGAENSVAWEHHWNILKVVQQLKNDGYQLWALEGGKTAVNIFKNIHAIDIDQPIALVVGNEVNGIDPDVVNRCDYCVFIPMTGVKESLNVATAFGIAAYLLRFGKSIA